MFHAKAQRRKGKAVFYRLICVCALLLLALARVWAQCAMCRTAAEATAGFNLGILVLLIPPVGIFCAIFWTAYKFQDPSREGKDD